VAIVVQTIVEGRRFSGWLDPRYPIGFWQGAASLTGDASGGNLGIDLLFQQANGPERLNSQMYSVERFSISSRANADAQVQLRALNMGGPSNQGFRHDYAATIEAFGTPSDSAVVASMMAILPWFLGSQRLAGTTASLSIITDNVDGITWDFEAEGYRWSPRSILVDGGPQRPPTGLYRT